MSNKGQLLQDPFLNTLRKEHVPVSIYLVNGIKLQGQIESFDQYVVLLRNSVTQMVYKHAISTVVPSRPISLGPTKPPNKFLLERPAAAADPQAAIIVCLDFGDEPHDEEAEVVRLVQSAGVLRHRVLKGRRSKPDPRFYAGSGKVDEIAARAGRAERDVRGVQPRAFAGAGKEHRKGDRAARDGPHRADPRDLRAARAHREGKLQVELAQLEHLSTRLVRGWTHLERQRGGLGKTGGPARRSSSSTGATSRPGFGFWRRS